MGKKVLITGATGMVGRLVLEHCLGHAEIDEVVSLSRRSVSLTHPKLTEHLIEDFLALDTTADYWSDIDVVYYCAGVYTGSVSTEEFVQVTVDHPFKLAELVFLNSPGARFCLLSGNGADRTEKSKILFARQKGIIENKLAKFGFGDFHSFRPSYIYPVTPRDEPGFGYKLMRAIYPIIKLFGATVSIKSTELAASIFKVGLEGHKMEVLENKDILAVVR